MYSLNHAMQILMQVPITQNTGDTMLCITSGSIAGLAFASKTRPMAYGIGMVLFTCNALISLNYSHVHLSGDQRLIPMGLNILCAFVIGSWLAADRIEPVDINKISLAALMHGGPDMASSQTQATPRPASDQIAANSRQSLAEASHQNINPLIAHRNIALAEAYPPASELDPDNDQDDIFEAYSKKSSKN